MSGRPNRKYSQAARVLELYQRLLEPSGYVSPVLDYHDFGCDKRTLQRDIAVLKDLLGDELEHHEEPHLGWVYRLTKGREWQVQPSQVLAIVAGARATRFVSSRKFSNEIQPILEQLRTSLPHGEKLMLRRIEEKLYITHTGEKQYQQQPEKHDVLAAFVDGLMEQRAVELHYLSHNRASQQKPALRLVVFPLSLVFHRGGVYFVAEILDGEMPVGLRITLALDRASDAAVRADLGVLEYPSDYFVETFFDEAFGIHLEGTLHDAVIRFTPLMSPYVLERRWNSSETFEPQPDGSLLMRLRVRGEREIVEWVAGMGKHAEILAPPALRAAVVKHLEEALDQYGAAENGS